MTTPKMAQAQQWTDHLADKRGNPGEKSFPNLLSSILLKSSVQEAPVPEVLRHQWDSRPRNHTSREDETSPLHTRPTAAPSGVLTPPTVAQLSRRR